MKGAVVLVEADEGACGGWVAGHMKTTAPAAKTTAMGTRRRAFMEKG
jgi:hypothetical protein